MSPAGRRAPTMLDQAAVAARLGVTRETVQRYRAADRDKYRFPEPDGHLGRTPWWWCSTIDSWAAARPGKGAGAGRPRKTPRVPQADPATDPPRESRSGSRRGRRRPG